MSSSPKLLKSFILFSLLLLMHQVSLSQSVKGKITDNTTGEPLVGASVTLKPAGTVSIVKLDGTYLFKNVPAGTYQLEVSYAGYESIITTVTLTQGQNSITLNLTTQPLSKSMATVNVTAVKKSDDARARRLEQKNDQIVNIVSSKTLQLLPDITVANAIQRVSGVTIEKSNSGEGRYPIIRGMEKRYINTLVNGIKIPSPDNKSRFVPLDLFPSEILERLEVSKSLTPSQEGDAIGGTINLVMKDAPARQLFQVNFSSGYNTILSDQSFHKFSSSSIAKKSPNEKNGNTYAAVPSDFSVAHLDYTKRNFPVNTTLGITYGNRVGKDKRLGFILAGSYQNIFKGTNSTVFLPNSQPGIDNVPQFIELQHRTYSTQSRRIGLSGKLDWALAKNHKLSLFTTYIRLDDFQSREITDTIALNSLVDAKTRSSWQYQSIYNSTLQGTHTIAGGFRADWSLVYSVANNHVPAQTEFTHEYPIVSNSTSIDKVQGLSALWMHNADRDYAAYLNLTKTFKVFKRDLEIKAGGMYRDKHRDNFYNIYNLKPTINEPFTSIDSAKFVTDGSTPKANGNNYTVTEDIAAAYLQARWQVLPRLEILGGLRMENTRQHYNTQFGPEIDARSGKIWYTDWLPSLQLKYSLNARQALRFAYYKALARPGFADIIPDGTEGDELQEKGNPAGILHSVADNFDLRYEYFPGAADQVLLGVFYKNIKDPIEYSIVQGINTSQTIQPVNWGKATNYGFEAVATKYFGVFGFSVNYTYTQSEITTAKKYKYRDPITTFATSKDSMQTRPLQGQSDHVANISLLYKNPRNGLDIQVALVYTGKRLINVNPFYNFDYWQSPTTQLDISFEKRFLKKFSVYGKFTNLTDAPAKSYIKQSYNSYLAAAGRSLSLQTDPDTKIYVQKNYFRPAVLIGFRYKF